MSSISWDTRSIERRPKKSETAGGNDTFLNLNGFCRHFCLGGGFKYFLFSPLFGEDFQFD